MSFPKIIYKYREWGNPKHEQVIKDQILYFASPKDFNDPFDCRIIPNVYLLDSDKLKLKFAEAIVSRLSIMIKKRGLNAEDEKIRIFRILKSDPVKYQMEFEKLYTERQNDYYGVVSFGTSWKNQVLWGNYANNHKGYCVAFDEEILRDSNLFGKAGIVNYTNKYPEILPDLDGDREPTKKRINKSFTETHTKSKKWSKEKEYRATRLFYENKDIPTVKDRLVSFPKNAVKEIIIGCQATNSTIEEIKYICNEKGFKVSKVYKIPFKFGLEKKVLRYNRCV